MFVKQPKPSILLNRVRQRLLLAVALCLALLVASGESIAQTDWSLQPVAQEPSQVSPDLIRAQSLMQAKVFGLAEKILETRAPAVQPNMEWLQWERQLWSLYQAQGKWKKLYQRTQQVPLNFPQSIYQEAMLQAIKALTELQDGSSARSLIRQQLLSSEVEAPHEQQIRRQLRQALIAAYLADGLLNEARITVDSFYTDYGSQDTEWSLLSAGVLLQSGDPSAAINLLAPLHHPAVQLLRLYARLSNKTLTPKQVIARVRGIMATPHGRALARANFSMLAHANFKADHIHSFIVALENYLITASPHNQSFSHIYPQFEIDDLFEAYTTIAQQYANQSGWLIGDEAQWLEYFKQKPSNSTVVHKALFAYVATNTNTPSVRQRAVDSYVNILLDHQQVELIELLFGEHTVLGNIQLGEATALRLSAYALDKNKIQLAADTNANLSQLPAGEKRNDWLLQSGRIDIFAGRYQQGVGKLNEWIDVFNRFTTKQTNAILQPIFDLQTAKQHQLALQLLNKINTRVATDKHRREISYWLAESYDASGQHIRAAELFLRSAFQQDNGLDEWGQAARFRAAETLMHNDFFSDAKRLLEDLLKYATEPNRRSALKQKLQQLWLLQSNLHATERGE